MFSIFPLLCMMSAVAAASAVNIMDYKAIPDEDSRAAALANARALNAAIVEANGTANSADRVVYIPKDRVFYMAGVTVEGLTDISIMLEGTIRFSDDMSLFANGFNGDKRYPQLYFIDADGITITGGGTIDGQGMKWWRVAYTGLDNRPRMVEFDTSINILIYDITLLNSPSYHLNFKDVANLVIHDITIFVNSTLERGPHDDRDSVMYPLNTDGIDIAATNVTVYNCNITNYDDAIVPKPCRSNYKYCQCSGDMVVRNNNIYYSTGLTIGSVPPNDDVNCVRNVTFRDNYMFRPLKAIYIKSNPGDTGSGIIDNIVYENILIEQALWWTVWIGPQQQNQPGGDSGTGCNFLYPFVPDCPTQPLVSITNIRLTNVTAVDTLPLFEGPGVVLCDEETPCTNIIFENVTNSMFPGDIDDIFAALPLNVPQIVFPTKYRTDDWVFEYITENAYGSATDCDPNPVLL